MSETAFKVRLDPELAGNPIRDFWINLDDGGKYCPFYVQQIPGDGMRASGGIHVSGLNELLVAIADETVKRREADDCVGLAADGSQPAAAPEMLEALKASNTLLSLLADGGDHVDTQISDNDELIAKAEGLDG